MAFESADFFPGCNIPQPNYTIDRFVIFWLGVTESCQSAKAITATGKCEAAVCRECNRIYGRLVPFEDVDFPSRLPIQKAKWRFCKNARFGIDRMFDLAGAYQNESAV